MKDYSHGHKLYVQETKRCGVYTSATCTWVATYIHDNVDHNPRPARQILVPDGFHSWATYALSLAFSQGIALIDFL